MALFRNFTGPVWAVFTGNLLLLLCFLFSLSQFSKGLPVKYILFGVAVLFFASLLVTSILFHRIVTSELMIIHLWIALELSLIAVLYGSGFFGLSRAAAFVTLVFLGMTTA